MAAVPQHSARYEAACTCGAGSPTAHSVRCTTSSTHQRTRCPWTQPYLNRFQSAACPVSWWLHYVSGRHFKGGCKGRQVTPCDSEALAVMPSPPPSFAPPRTGNTEGGTAMLPVASTTHARPSVRCGACVALCPPGHHPTERIGRGGIWSGRMRKESAPVGPVLQWGRCAPCGRRSACGRRRSHSPRGPRGPCTAGYPASQEWGGACSCTLDEVG